MNSGIYIIKIDETTKYVGRTVNFYERIHTHLYYIKYISPKSDFKLYNELRRHPIESVSFEILEYEDNLDRLLLLEREYYDILVEEGIELFNTIKPLGKSEKEKAELRKQYRLNNLEKIKVKKKIKNAVKTVCKCGGSYSIDHKQRHFKTRLHKDFINSVVHTKPEIIKHKCACSGKYVSGDESRHFRTGKHLDFVNGIVRVKKGVDIVKKKEMDRKYYHKNKKAITEYKKEYGKSEHGKNTIKEYQKVYKALNKENMLEKGKAYYQSRKDRVKCECGSEHTVHGTSKHIKSAKHIKFIS